MVDVSTTLALGPLKVSPFERLALLLQSLEDNSLLFQETSLKERLLAIDELDVLLGVKAFAEIELRALALHERLEAANAKIYQSIRSDIMRGEKATVLQWLRNLTPSDEKLLGPRPSFGFDTRDDFVASIFQHSDPGDLSSSISREMIAYQPTPVRHVLRLLQVLKFATDDLFVDLGSGLGHVPLLVSMLAGVQSLGIEIEPAYVANAEECANSFQLQNASFIAADARDTDFSKGTIFYLYSPFTGSILQNVLASLQKQSQKRPIKLCSLGPCTCNLEKQKWLKVKGSLDPARITLFESQ